MTRIFVDEAEWQELSKSLPKFDGYPYLVSKVVPTLYHVILLPKTEPVNALRSIAQWQVRKNGFESCLVLSADQGIYFDELGEERGVSLPPIGEILVSDRLMSAPLPDTRELLGRRRKLNKHIENQRKQEGYLYGDLTKGGHPATSEEAALLDGFQPNGVPNGLTVCQKCGAYFGNCLDPNPQFAGNVMPVTCQCDNQNRCARCSELLFDWKLNSNFYNPKDGQIWHVPGFCGLQHICANLKKGG